MDNDVKIHHLCLGKFLYKMTDEEQFLIITEIIELLKSKCGINGHRTIIASDIELLQRFGMDIGLVKSQSNMYHLVSRGCDLPELKLLIDTVSSSKFITEKKSKYNTGFRNKFNIYLYSLSGILHLFIRLCNIFRISWFNRRLSLQTGDRACISYLVKFYPKYYKPCI